MDSWNEYVSKQSFASYVLRRIYLRLASEVEGSGGGPESYAPSLAESWEFTDGRTSIVFRLRDAVWSDGTPITADDVRFTWLAQTSEHVPWANGDVKDRITDVEVVDSRTVRFRFDAPYPYQFADAVDGGILPKHVFDKVRFSEWATHDWSQYRIASGPFVLDRHRGGDEIVLARNPRYHDTSRPMLDRVVIRIIPDMQGLLTQLRTGEIDFLVDVPPREASRVAERTNDSLDLVSYDIPRYDYLGWNCERAPFDDPQVRRALTQAIDREALVEELIYGFGTIASRPVPSNWWGASKRIAPWPYNPDAAKRILAQRGYGPGRETLRLELITNAGNQLREDTLIKIQEQLSRIGVEVEVRTMEQAALIRQVASGDFDAYLGGWNFAGKIPLSTLFRSDARYPRGFNVVRYASADMDADLAMLDGASDVDTMRAALEAIQTRIHDDQPYTFLFEREGVAVHGKRLRDVTVETPSDPLAGLERFWVAASR